MTAGWVVFGVVMPAIVCLVGWAGAAIVVRSVRRNAEPTPMAMPNGSGGESARGTAPAGGAERG